MTRDRALKQAVRKRAARTGEKYTEARRAVLDDEPALLERAMAEFERQVGSLVDKGYPRVAGLAAADFIQRFDPLKDRVRDLLGSRCGDRRVIALWISKNRPKLAWCWAGNPHTWLGSASCAGRTGR